MFCKKNEPEDLLKGLRELFICYSLFLSDSNNRIYDFNSSDYTTNNSSRLPVSKETSNTTSAGISQPVVEIRNARFLDDTMDGKIQRGELSKVIFEVMNHSSEMLVDVQPEVIETTKNKHIKISPSIHVESIQPGTGIRYTVQICGQSAFLFDEENGKWFVEAKS